MRIILTSIAAFGAAMFVTAISNEGLVLLALLIIGGVSSLGALIASVFYKGSLGERLMKASKITFPLTATAYVLGYLYGTLKVMI